MLYYYHQICKTSYFWLRFEASVLICHISQKRVHSFLLLRMSSFMLFFISLCYFIKRCYLKIYIQNPQNMYIKFQSGKPLAFVCIWGLYILFKFHHFFWRQEPDADIKPIETQTMIQKLCAARYVILHFYLNFLRIMLNLNKNLNFTHHQLVNTRPLFLPLAFVNREHHIQHTSYHNFIICLIQKKHCEALLSCTYRVSGSY